VAVAVAVSVAVAVAVAVEQAYPSVREVVDTSR
jgi:hypothetical protein